MSLSDKYKELQLETIQSQYSASSHILGLTEGFATVVDPSDDIDLFYEKVFDLSTAVGWGLENWGRILAQPRAVINASTEYFGFNYQELHPFGQAPFFSGTSSDIETYTLTDTGYRSLLIFKAMANISNATAATMNEILAYAFPDIFLSVIDHGDMTLSLVFSGEPEAMELQLITFYGSLIKGAGVGWNYYVINVEQTFGFDESSGLAPFDCGIFGDDMITWVS